MIEMTTVTIRINDGATFGRTLKFVKESRGARYNASDKTWTIPANHRILGAGVNRSSYKFEVIGNAATTSDRCPHYTVDQGCPLHGEFCEESR